MASRVNVGTGPIIGLHSTNLSNSLSLTFHFFNFFIVRRSPFHYQNETKKNEKKEQKKSIDKQKTAE